jgi:LPS-assembly protein
LRQTLEPRLHYLRTPWRNQDTLPNFDTAELDFNELSIYGDNAFSGIDFVNDANQVTLGVTSRWFDQDQGAELLRLGIAQRYLFNTQRITTDRLTTSGLSEEAPSTSARSFSDLLLFGSTSLIPKWQLDARWQYNPDLSRTSRAVFAARWQPEPFHTLSATYRYTRDLSEQVELGWQWPIYKGTTTSDGRCGGNLYGVGRVNYSLQDQRFTDTIAGVEYDAGCWVGRVVAKRVSTGQSEATTQLMVQLELVGLSRLGANPLKVLKDNIPGYQLLRDESDTQTTAP